MKLPFTLLTLSRTVQVDSAPLVISRRLHPYGNRSEVSY
jgi:hypothetical protein